MGLFLQAVISAILLVSVSTANNLPGLLSRRLCEATPLTDVGPVCNCVNLTYFDSLESLCRSLNEASECLEQIHGTIKGHDIFGYSFDKDRFLSNMNYLCDLAKEFDDTSECGDNDAVLECETEFINHLSNMTEVLQEEACSMTDKLSDCYWKNLKGVRLCPERAKILYAKLAEAYLPSVCTKFDDETRGAECQRFYPKIPTPYSECVESVLEKANCLVRDRKVSQHHEDIYWETGFDVNRYIEFSKLTCLIEEERDRECYSNNEARRNCTREFDSISSTQIRMIKNGDTVPEEDICSALEYFTACVEVALKDCPIEVTNLNSLICANMPQSCHCPVRLAEERTARSTGDSMALRPEILLILFMFSLLYLK